ncbi:MAG: amidohydrolase family protein [Anaerolineales bacterium]|jgi:cytosine/adenosine deaminase-related metal-dependent hydrolase
MEKLLIKHGLVVTLDAQDRIFRDGTIYIENGRIVEVGPGSSIADKPGVKVIDATGKIVMPGMISCHNHLYSAVVRSIPYSGFESPDFSFVSWMDRFWLPLLEDRVDQNIMYAGTRANVVDHIRSGITTTADTAEGSYALPGALEAVDRACMETGIRAVLSFETTGRISEENAALGLQENINQVKRCRSRSYDRITARIGVHTTYTCPTELLQEVKKTADELGVGYMMHHLDDRWHHFDTCRRFGKRPTRYLADIGFLSPNLILFHCSYIDQWQDPPIFKQYDVKVAHNAESNAIFSFWPDMLHLIREGVTVGLGTDGQTFNYFEVMRTAQMIHRIKYENPELMKDDQVLRMATIDAARVLQMEDQIGSLEVGKKADIVFLSDRSTVPLFEVNVKNYIVGTCERTDVDTVIVDGEIILLDGQFIKFDEREIQAKSKEEAVRLWQRNEWPLP